MTLTAKPPDGRWHQRRQATDDINDAIYTARILDGMSWRDVGKTVGLSANSARDRFLRHCRRMKPGDAADLRAEESDRIDELRSTAQSTARACATAGDLELALKYLREVHALTRTYIQLWGLDRREEEPADIDNLNTLIGAYLQGAADATDPTP